MVTRQTHATKTVLQHARDFKRRRLPGEGYGLIGRKRVNKMAYATVGHVIPRKCKTMPQRPGDRHPLRLSALAPGGAVGDFIDRLAETLVMRKWCSQSTIIIMGMIPGTRKPLPERLRHIAIRHDGMRL